MAEAEYDLHPYPAGDSDAPFVLRLYLKDRLVQERVYPWLEAHPDPARTRSLCVATLMGGGRNWYGFQFSTKEAKEAFRAEFQKYDLYYGTETS